MKPTAAEAAIQLHEAKLHFPIDSTTPHQTFHCTVVKAIPMIGIKNVTSDRPADRGAGVEAFFIITLDL